MKQESIYRPTATGMRPMTACAVIGLALAPGIVSAEEGGSGHYLPGSMASFMDGVPPHEVFMMRLNYLNYDGSATKHKPLPLTGLTALRAAAKSTGLGVTLVWRPAFEIGEGWSYAMAMTIPNLWREAAAEVNAKGATVRRSTSVNGLGDIVIQPLLLNQNASPDFNINYRVSVYAPTGSYELNRLANTGKYFWAIEPNVDFMYFGQKNGRADG